MDDPQSLPIQLLRFAEDLEEQVQDALTSLHTVAGPVLAVVLMLLLASVVVMAGKL